MSFVRHISVRTVAVPSSKSNFFTISYRQ